VTVAVAAARERRVRSRGERNGAGLVSVGRAIKRRLKAAIAPAVFLALVGYFLWNANQGDRGLEAAAQRQSDLVAATAGLDRAKAELQIWERRVASLRGNRINPDAVDERARAILNLSDPSDIVVPLGKNERLF
jgi:cell division protein FtsB